jgi:uncharacterized protein
MDWTANLRALGLGIALALSAASAAPCADYAPIDCARASDSAQRTICRDYGLGQAEARMATLYGVIASLVAMGQRANLQDTQRDWLKTRDACRDDRDCLANTYAGRIQELNAMVADIASRGPF